MHNNTSVMEESCPGGSTEAEFLIYESVAWWVEGVVLIIIGILGILANLVAIPVLLSRLMTNVFNRTLAILAIFDTLFNFLDVLESLRQNHGSNGYIHLHLFPVVLYPLQNIVMVCSIYTTVVVAIERYLAVSRPISSFVGDAGGKGWKKVLVYVTPVVIFSVLFNLPTFFEFYVVDGPDELVAGGTNLSTTSLDSTRSVAYNESETNYPQLRISDIRSDAIYVLYYINIARNTVTGIFPFVSLAILNYLVYKHLVRRRNSVAYLASNSYSKQMTVENRQSHTLFGVVTLFFIGHALRIFLNLHEILAIKETAAEHNKSAVEIEDHFVDIVDVDVPEGTMQQYDDYIYVYDPCVISLPLWSMVLKSVCRLLITISSSANLLIYCVASKPFRRVLWLKYRHCVCITRSENNLFGSEFESRTRATSFQMRSRSLSQPDSILHHLTSSVIHNKNLHGSTSPINGFNINLHGSTSPINGLDKNLHGSVIASPINEHVKNLLNH